MCVRAALFVPFFFPSNCCSSTYRNCRKCKKSPKYCVRVYLIAHRRKFLNFLTDDQVAQNFFEHAVPYVRRYCFLFSSFQTGFRRAIRRSPSDTRALAIGERQTPLADGRADPGRPSNRKPTPFLLLLPNPPYTTTRAPHALTFFNEKRGRKPAAPVHVSAPSGEVVRRRKENKKTFSRNRTKFEEN